MTLALNTVTIGMFVPLGYVRDTAMLKYAPESSGCLSGVAQPIWTIESIGQENSDFSLSLVRGLEGKRTYVQVLSLTLDKPERDHRVWMSS